MRKRLLVLVSAGLIGGCATDLKPKKIRGMRFDPARQAEQQARRRSGLRAGGGRVERVAERLHPDQRHEADTLAADWLRENGAP